MKRFFVLFAVLLLGFAHVSLATAASPADGLAVHLALSHQPGSSGTTGCPDGSYDYVTLGGPGYTDGSTVAPSTGGWTVGPWSTTLIPPVGLESFAFGSLISFPAGLGLLDVQFIAHGPDGHRYFVEVVQPRFGNQECSIPLPGGVTDGATTTYPAYWSVKDYDVPFPQPTLWEGCTNLAITTVDPGSEYTFDLTLGDGRAFDFTQPFTCPRRVSDTTAPTVFAPPNTTVEAGADTSPISTGIASATDDSGTVAVAYNDTVLAGPPGANPVKTIFRDWTATDPSGNFAHAVQTITVVDTTPPTINCPANIALTAYGHPVTATYEATATDTGGPTTIGYSTPPGSSFGVGTSTVTATATDRVGNTAGCSFTITVRQAYPSTTTECKTNGWTTFGIFKNQGDCVSYVSTDGKNRP
jgi:hypothetical protein